MTARRSNTVTEKGEKTFKVTYQCPVLLIPQSVFIQAENAEWAHLKAEKRIGGSNFIIEESPPSQSE